MDLRLDGKTALVNGASRGIGYATAMALASEGVNVAISARHNADIEIAAEQLRSDTSAKIVPIQGDIRVESDVTRIIEETCRAFGGVDILINNDGAPPLGELLTFDDLAWHKAIEQNLFSVVRMIRGLAGPMRDRGGGSIVNVTSLTAIEPATGFGLSASTWAAVISLAKTLSIELGTHNIRVNTVCPGRLESSRMRTVLAMEAAQVERDPQDIARERQEAVPLRRYGDLEEVADVITFLASPRSSYLTGVTLPIDGGARRSLL